MSFLFYVLVNELEYVKFEYYLTPYLNLAWRGIPLSKIRVEMASPVEDDFDMAFRNSPAKRGESFNP